MLDGSDSGEINALAIMKDGNHFATGGEDKKLKVWDYDEGISYYAGTGHSGSITKVRNYVIIIYRLLYHQINRLLYL
jgi:WD40 repeat protein